MRLAMLAMAVGGGMLAYQIWSFQEVREEATADAAIVLGAAVWGGDPSPVFAERIRHAIELYDLETDPGETTDLAPRRLDVLRRLAPLFDSERTPSEHFPLVADK